MNDQMKRSLLFFYTETSLHAGSGTGVGAIDLPLQRERMSDLPQVQGSGVKGALRELFRAGDNEEDRRQLEEVLFGPRPLERSNGEDQSASESIKAAKAQEHAGALAVTDARLLLLPVRSAYGGWAWVTSPLILQRLARDLACTADKQSATQKSSAKQPTDANPAWASLTVRPNKALIAKSDVAVARKGRIVIEDACYDTEVNGALAKLAEFIASALPSSAVYESIRKRLLEQIVVLSDEEMCYWAKHGTEVVTRVRIDPKTGTVETGALWTEEALPSESLLWSLVMISDGRKPNVKKMEAAELQSSFFAEIDGRGRIFLGGDRTVGRGLVALGRSGGSHGTSK